MKGLISVMPPEFPEVQLAQNARGQMVTRSVSEGRCGGSLANQLFARNTASRCVIHGNSKRPSLTLRVLIVDVKSC